VKVDDAWLLDQMRANIALSQDLYSEEKVADDWAQKMEAAASAYNRVQRKSINVVATDDDIAEEQVDTVVRRSSAPTRGGSKGPRKGRLI